MKKVLYVFIGTSLLMGLSGCGITDSYKNAKDISDKIINEIEEDVNNVQEEITENKYSASEIENIITSQPVYVYKSYYQVQDDNYKCIYPDLLITNIKNNSGDIVKNVKVAYVAWDKNNLPVKIESGSADDYLVTVNFSDVNLINGATYDDYGLSLSCLKDSNIAKFKAIVVSYENFNGDVWENPLYENWKNIYEDQILQ